jgi:hypothetical protein
VDVVVTESEVLHMAGEPHRQHADRLRYRGGIL